MDTMLCRMRRDYYENPSQVRKKGVQAETAWTPFDYPALLPTTQGYSGNCRAILRSPSNMTSRAHGTHIR